MAVVVPKVIHRVWVGGPIPDQFLQFGESWRRKNRGWKVELWTEGNLPTLRNQRLYDAAPSLVSPRLVPRFRSNLIRYEVLERFGGLYVDTDFEALRPVSPLIDGLDCFAAEEKPGLIANGFMGCVPEHPFITALIDGCEQSVAERPGLPSWRTTGPEYLTRMAEQLPGQLKLVDRSLVYPYHHTELEKGGRPPMVNEGAVCHHVWASRRKQVSVLIPFGGNDPHRVESLGWVTNQLRAVYPDWQIVVARYEATPFSKTRAILAGYRQCFGDVLVVHDSDVWTEGLGDAVEQVRKRCRWAVPHRHVHRLTEGASAAFMAGGAVDMQDCVEVPYRGVLGGGVVVMRREAFEACPPDPRFAGWGGEDISWAMALRAVAGTPWRGNEPLVHLWHPPEPRLERSKGNEENHRLFQTYGRAAVSRQRMRRLMDEVRQLPEVKAAVMPHMA